MSNGIVGQGVADARRAGEWVIATRNLGKLREFQQILAPLGLRMRSIGEFPHASEPEENGATFAANAIIKAQAAAAATGLWALADDSGLCVDALDGAPGVHSARHVPGSDADRRKALLNDLDDVEDAKRGAAFVCVLALVSPDGAEVHTFEGSCRGAITRSERGLGGFGYDSIFALAGDPQSRTTAELSADEKNAVSHRGRALARLVEFLREEAG